MYGTYATYKINYKEKNTQLNIYLSNLASTPTPTLALAGATKGLSSIMYPVQCNDIVNIIAIIFIKDAKFDHYQTNLNSNILVQGQGGTIGT